MKRFISASIDASIYQEFSWRNTGHDEILSIGKSSDGVSAIRSLIRFDIQDISSSLSLGNIPLNATYDLRLSVARASSLSQNQRLTFQLISQSWDEGSGFFYQNTNVPFTASRNPTGGFFENNGATWTNITSGSSWTTPGGDYISDIVLSQSISDPVTDVLLDVSPLVIAWVSGTVDGINPLQNNGLIIKYPDTDESSSLNNGSIDFFSRQTHTIYQPLLIAKWDDQIYITGSMSASNPDNAAVVPKNLRPKYRIGELVRVDLSVRDRYPIKQFDTVFTAFAGDQKLPNTSYFSIVDAQSNFVILPFDDSSKLSCDGISMYCTFHIEGMYPGRFYKILIKVIDSGYENIYEPGHLFSVESV